MCVFALPLEELENLALSKHTFSDLESRDIAGLILGRMSDYIREACFGVLAENEVQTVVPVDIGLTQFALARRIRALRLRALQIAA
jgi:hypothetical protein